MCGGWIGKHKKELLAGLALGGVGALTGGFGLLGGSAASSGLLGAEAGAGAAAGGLAGADAIGAGAGTMGPIGTMMANGSLGTGLESFGKIAKLSQMSGLLGQQAPPPTPPPQGGVTQAPLPTVPTLQEMYGHPVIDEETLRRRMRGYG